MSVCLFKVTERLFICRYAHNYTVLSASLTTPSYDDHMILNAYRGIDRLFTSDPTFILPFALRTIAVRPPDTGTVCLNYSSICLCEKFTLQFSSIRFVASQAHAALNQVSFRYFTDNLTGHENQFAMSVRSCCIRQQARDNPF